MSFSNRIIKSYDCLNAFKSNCTDGNIVKFVDIFYPILFNKIKGSFYISVGEKKNGVFQKWLGTYMNKIKINLNQWNNEPQLIISNCEKTNNAVLSVCLAFVNNVAIKVDETDTFISYEIEFNYDNKIDYQMNLKMNK
jgi:hypothetical protein